MTSVESGLLNLVGAKINRQVVLQDQGWRPRIHIIFGQNLSLLDTGHLIDTMSGQNVSLLDTSFSFDIISGQNVSCLDTGFSFHIIPGQEMSAVLTVDFFKYQGSPTLFLDTYLPVGFCSNTNLAQLILHVSNLD